jgi:hypothetical protein
LGNYGVGGRCYSKKNLKSKYHSIVLLIAGKKGGASILNCFLDLIGIKKIYI